MFPTPSAELSPPPFDYDPNITVTGALIPVPREATELPSPLAAFIESGPPPIYLGFGSMTDTVSPAPMPCFASALARRRALA